MRVRAAPGPCSGWRAVHFSTPHPGRPCILHALPCEHCRYDAHPQHTNGPHRIAGAGLPDRPLPSLAQAPNTEPAAALVLSADGSLVIDTRARLAWPRCVEGMQWTGTTCTGTPLEIDHAQALAHANARWKAEGLPWRLPRAAELRRLVDKSGPTPGLDARLFPVAPSGWYWAVNANVKGAWRATSTTTATWKRPSARARAARAWTPRA